MEDIRMEDVDEQQNDSKAKKGKLRFDVTHVPGGSEDTDDMNCLPSDEVNSSLHHCSTAENTIGYGTTHEAVPMTVFYRNDSSQHEGKTSRKARPTMDQLRKGFANDGVQNQSEIQVGVLCLSLIIIF